MRGKNRYWRTYLQVYMRSSCCYIVLYCIELCCIVLYCIVLYCIVLYCIVFNFIACVLLCYTASFFIVCRNFRLEVFTGSGVRIRQSENVCACVCVQSFYFSVICLLLLYLKLSSNYLIFLLHNPIFAVLQ